MYSLCFFPKFTHSIVDINEYYTLSKPITYIRLDDEFFVFIKVCMALSLKSLKLIVCVLNRRKGIGHISIKPNI